MVSGMKNDLLAGWVAFLGSPAAPAMAMRPLELEGYLTGLVVAPDLIPPSLWIPHLWGDDEPVFDDAEQMQTALDSVMGHYNAIIRQIDNHIDGNGPAWLPMYFDGSGTANIEQCTQWARGFCKTMAFAPDVWLDLVDHERSSMLVEPFTVFFNIDEIDERLPPEEVDEVRRASAEHIPSVLSALRKMAQILASKASRPMRSSSKIGRNEPCPCGSGKKYKRCCGLN